ncbi:MAG: hypothetical protein WDN24_02875 [Sphingomonas sp.]
MPKLGERRWRFVREVGSVVLGVLIALGIGEIAETVRWQWRLSVSREAMRAELSANRRNAVERLTYQPCLERRLAAIGAILAETRRTYRLPRVGPIGGPGRRVSEHTALEVATGEGVFLHMPRGEAREIAALYKMAVTYYEEEVVPEQEAWARLRLIENAPGPIDSDLLASLLEAWAEANNRAMWIGRIAQQNDEGLGAFGVPVEAMEGEADLAAFRRETLQRPICKPLTVDGKPFAAPG